MGIQIKRKALTKTFIVISNWENALIYQRNNYYAILSDYSKQAKLWIIVIFFDRGGHLRDCM